MQTSSCPANKHLNQRSLHCILTISKVTSRSTLNWNEKKRNKGRKCLMRMPGVEDMFKSCQSCVQCVCAHVYLHKWVGKNKETIQMRGTIEIPVGEFPILTNTVVLYPKISLIFCRGAIRLTEEKHAMTVISHNKVCSSSAPENLWLRRSNNWKTCFPSAFNQPRSWWNTLAGGLSFPE